jgi:hypothetical protein
MPNAAIPGPIIKGNRAPNRSTNPPAQRERTAIRTVGGRKAAPAKVAGNPCTWIKTNGRKKNTPPIAPYRSNVKTLTVLNVRDAKRLTGKIGERPQYSANTNAMSSINPPAREANTIG